MVRSFRLPLLVALAGAGCSFSAPVLAQAPNNPTAAQAEEDPYASLPGPAIVLPRSGTTSSRFEAFEENVDGYIFEKLGIVFGDLRISHQYPPEGFFLQPAASVAPFTAVLRLPRLEGAFVGLAHYETSPVEKFDEQTQLRYLRGIADRAPQGQTVSITRGPLEGNRETVVLGFNTRSYQYDYVSEESGEVVRRVREFLTLMGDGSLMLSRYEGSPAAFEQIAPLAEAFLQNLLIEHE
ncbi:MAG: hypothetical protein Q7P63_07470 [Verrucomicrobiota bacterium JB022]|nr:hypothetical protein [Verrucomicrobiota bacterium JB022]